MKSNILIGALIIVTAGMIGVMTMQAFPGDKTSSGVRVAATMYKSPSCSCCGQYAAYLGKEGYDIDIEATTDMSAIKEQYNVPLSLESCHTMEIAGYVIEGHIPKEAIQKLIAETPDIKGIGMAGMPSGSPGMPGPKTSDFVIYEITHDGAKGNVFMTI